MKNILTFILAGGKGVRLYPLTKNRAKPAVPFMGVYRIIDFVLSNTVNSGLRKIVLLTQYLSLSLDRHIRQGWDLFKYDVDGYLYPLPAQQRYGERWYEGTADAVYQNIYTLQMERPEHLLILSGDHIYKMNYQPLIEQHIKKDADFTLVALLYPRIESSRFGTVDINRENRVNGFIEKPSNPPPYKKDDRFSLVNAGIYIAKTESLVKVLIEDARNSYSTHDFGKDVIPKMINEGYKVYAYVFDGYWKDIGTLDSYFETNNDFLNEEDKPINLKDPEFPIRTYFPPLPPAQILRGSEVLNSYISNGAEINGAKVINSIISPLVKIEKNAYVENSIIFERCIIGEGVRIINTIIDKDNFIKEKDICSDWKKYGLDITEKNRIVVAKGWFKNA